MIMTYIMVHVQALVVLALLPNSCRSWTGSTPGGRITTTHKGRNRLLGIDSSMTTSLYYTTNVTSGAFLATTTSSSSRERMRNSNETIVFDEFGMAKAGNDLEDLLLMSTTPSSASNIGSASMRSSSMRRPPRQQQQQSPRGSPQRHQPRAQEESVYHAIEQVHAIMDIYTVSNNAISSDMITSTLDGVIQTVFREKTHITVRGNFANNNNTILHELEGLVWRLGELNIPLDSIMALKAMLSMQRHKYGAESLESKRAYIDRAAKLLLFYCQGGNSNSQQQQQQQLLDHDDLLDHRRQEDWVSSSPTSLSFLWPREDVREVLDFAKSNKAGMTPHLWDLFQHLSAHDPLETFVRDVTSDTLYILNHSGKEWSDQSERILMNLEDRYRATNNTLFSARSDELDLSLSTAATLGRAQHATWLFRKLYNGEQMSPAARKKLWYRLLTAYSQSHSVGSVTYMERLVLSQKETQHAEIFNLVLQAISNEETPGSGLRAEKFLNQTLALSCEATPYHSMESLRFCVQAYLSEEPRVLENVVNADALVRRFVSSTNKNGTGSALYHQGSKTGDTERGAFERLLEAYVSLAPTQPKAIIKHAESLVRFFLLHHRNGKISEVPSASHLDYILIILKQIPNKRNNETRKELESIFEKIARTKGDI